MEGKKDEVMQEMVGVQEEAYKSGSVQYIDSREVAEMVGKRHPDLKRDIKRYIAQLDMSKIAHVDFFIDSAYRDSENREQSCYLVTRKGCEFVANKLTGQKGTEFTATYINRFHEMEGALETQMAPEGFQLFMEQQRQFMERQQNFMDYQQNLMTELVEMNHSMSDRLDALESREEEPIHFTVGPGSKPFIVTADENAVRKKKLNHLVTKMAKACGWTRSFALHRLYKTLEEVLDISINDYVDLYQEETQKDQCAIDAVVASDNLYTEAVRLCNNTLHKMSVKE